MTATQVITYALMLDLDFELDAAMTGVVTMTVPSTATLIMADGVTATWPVSLQVSLSPTALVTVTAPAMETAPVTSEQAITTAPAVTTTPAITTAPAVTATPTVTSTPAVTEPPAITPGGEVTGGVETGAPEVGATTTVTSNLRAGPGPDFDVVTTVPPNTPVTVVAVSADGSWYLLEDATWIFGALVNNPPADIPVATDELIQQVTEEAAQRATPTPAPTVAPTAIPQPTATPTAAPSAVAPPPTVKVNANLRAGPGTEFEQIGGTITGQTINIIGQNAAGDWYLLDNGGWVFANLVDNPPADVPIVPDDATPESLGVTPPQQGPQLPTPTPAPAPAEKQPAEEQPAGGGITLGLAETLYLDEARNIASRYKTTADAVTGLVTNAAVNGALLQDANWTEEMNAAIGVLRRTGEQVRGVDAPPLFAAAHIDLVSAAASFDQAAALLEQGVNEGAIDLLQQGLAEFSTALPLLDASMEKLDQVAP